MADDSPRELVTEIMRKTRIASLTYEDAEGRLVSLPMGTQDFETPATVYFITERDSDKVRDIAAKPRVNVHYASGEGWVSLAGTARLDEDRARLKELWDASADVFMEGGPEDPNSALLRVDADTAEYWENPGALAGVVSLVKAAATDETPDLGESGTVSL